MKRIHAMRPRLWLCLLVCAILTQQPAWQKSSAAQSTQSPASPDGLWQELQRSQLSTQAGLPTPARALRLNRAGLLRALERAPMEFGPAQSTAVLTLPLPGGEFARFRIEESPALEPALAKRFPEIKSYRGQGVDDPALTMRCDWSPRGFYALILKGGQTINLQPVGAAKDDAYASYFGNDLNADELGCLVKEAQNVSPGLTRPSGPAVAVGPSLRNYRIAIAATWEYCNQYGGGTNAGTVASLNTWLNAANVIYEREVAVHFNLVNNTNILYTTERGFTAATDPYDNSSASANLNLNRTILRDTVGQANYDLGHVFGQISGTGGSGVAYVGVICNNNNNGGDGLGPLKGGGSTLVGGTAGNSVALGVWVHELGHQFGASHNFNGTLGNCQASNRSVNSSHETGSGSTIMAYVGICGNDNIATSRDMRFHTRSYEQITNHLAGGGGTCASTAATGNTAPTVSGGPDYTLPRNTPFTLTATGSDPDAGDAANLTYVWEQIDAGGSLYPQNGTEASYNDAADPGTTTRPVFRAFPPTASPARTFPSLTYILNNANDPPQFVSGLQSAEELPRIARTLNFRVTARDNRANGGGVNDDPVTLTISSAGPFLVTAPNTAINWTGTTTQTITWSVNGTNAAPVNCANVKISLSTDGGLTFPTVLAASTPNDGSESITVPNLVASNARIKVEAIGNIFFDISDVNFSITPGGTCPAVSALNPGVGNVGTSVVITGFNFTGVTAVRFSNNVNATFTVNSNTQITATVPNGAVTGPLTISKSGCADTQTATFAVCPNPPVNLVTDDGGIESAFRTGSIGGTTWYVNRLTPASYPATLSRVLVEFSSFQAVPAGTALNIVAAAHPGGGSTINNLSFQSVSAQAGTLEQFTSYAVAPLTINSGDFVVGYNLVQPSNSFPGLLDTTTNQNRGYVSTDGAGFTPVSSLGGITPGNLFIRAQVFTGNCGGPVCPAITLAPGSVPNGTINTAYSQTLTASGGTGPYTFSLAGGALPNGVTLAAGGALAGTPTQGGVFSFTARATDANNCSGTQAYTLTINCPAITVNPATLNAGTAGTAFSQTFTQTGGAGAVVWSFTGTLPPGLALAAGTGILSGTPATAGSYNFTIIATDANLCAGSRAYTLAINCPAVTVNPTTLPGGTAGTAYSQSVSATPAGTYSFAVTAGALPNGLTLNSGTGALTGNPTTPGTFNFTITATGFGTCTGNRAYTVVIACAALNVTPATLNAGTVGAAYSQAFAQTGGTGAITWSLTGALPTGLAFNAGTLSGTPTQPGSFPLTIKATDANGCMGTVTPTLTINCQTLTVNPAALPNGLANQPYNQTITQTGGVGTTTFSLSAGTLPNGLTLSSAGLLSGTPTQNGSFPITIKATDANGCMGTRAHTLVIGACPALGLTPAALNAGTVNTLFSQTLTGSGGTAPYSFSLQTGTLPTGVTLTAAGLLSGTPTQSGAFNLTIKATDTNGCMGTQAYTLTINCQTITVNPAGAIATGTVNAAYSQSFTQTGGVGTTTFSLSAGALPAGLTLSPAGALSGTPTQSGTFNPTIKATDANGCMGTRAYTLTVNCQTITLNPATLPAGTIGTAYNQTVTHTGGVGATTFSLSAGTLPAGLTLTSAGLLSGTPTQSGTFNITLKATDANGCMGTQAYALVINCPAITVNPATLPNGLQGIAYNQTLTASPSGGGTAPYSFAVTTGALPGGLTLTGGGVLAGNPAQQGTFNFTVTATANNGCTGTRAYTLTIGNCPVITLTPATLPAGTRGAAYNQTIGATGGAAPYSFTLTAGALPPGLTLAAQGALSGTPTQAGSFNFTVRAADNNACSGTQSYTLVINCSTITLSPASLPNGAVNAAYSQTITQTGGTGTTTFSISAGALPGGLTLSPAGLLSGAPSASGTFNFTVTATDAQNCPGTQAYTLTINCPTITVNPTTLPGGALNVAYSQTLTQSGGAGTVAWGVSAGALPGGLTLNAASGVLSGTPTASGSFNFTARATAGGCFGERAYALVIAACPAITISPATLPNSKTGVPYSQTLTALGGVGPYTFSLMAGALPNGLTLAANGTLSGTPTQTGTFNFTAQANYTSGNCTGARAYTLTIRRGFVRADFDGDGRTDLSIWRPGNGTWFSLNSSNKALQAVPWGAGYAPYFDVIVPGDYDGDGKTDQAIWRGQDSLWYIKKSSDSQPLVRRWGANYAPYNDVPVPGDYDGDGQTDLAVWRPGEGNWYIKRSSDNSNLVMTWGQSGDTPVPGDYDGDGLHDFAVWRPGTGEWLLKLSGGGTQTIPWGSGQAPYFDLPVAADYDGDGKTDPAIWRGQDSLWYIRQSSNGQPLVRMWGANYAPYNDVPAPGDFDGDGKADVAVWRPANGLWFVIRSTDNSFMVQTHGQQNDVPVPK